MGSDTRTALSRDAIVHVAVDHADREGLGSLSMRRLSDRLGYGTMSLYNHVQDKDDVLGGMLEHVLAERAPVPESSDWRTGLRAIATDLRRILGRHPWACDLWHTSFPGPHRTRLMEDVLGTLRRGGFGPRMAHHAFHAVDLYVVGHAHQAATFSIGLPDPEATLHAFLEQTPVEDFPYTIEHVAQHDGDGDDDDFEFMLELLLDGFERHIDD